MKIPQFSKVADNTGEAFTALMHELLSIYIDLFTKPGFKDPYKESNKVSSGAEDEAKSVQVGTHEVGHWSNLSRGQSSA